jgi:hypothetical protein
MRMPESDYDGNGLYDDDPKDRVYGEEPDPDPDPEADPKEATAAEETTHEKTTREETSVSDTEEAASTSTPPSR